MATDRRKKGCPNEDCERHQKKVMLKATENYCPKCGEPLIYVCAKCFCEIEDTDPKHKLCKRCEAKAEERKAELVKKAKAAGTKAKELAAPIGEEFIKKVAKPAKKEVVDKAINKANDIIHKKLKK